MKKVFTLFIVIIIYLQLPAQNVGIGNTNPQTALDVKGAIRSRPDTVVITQNYQIIDASNSSYIRLIKPAFIPDTYYSLNLTPGKDGQRLRLESNGNGLPCRLWDATYLSNGKKIRLKDPDPVFSKSIFFGNSSFLTYVDLIYVEELGWTETDYYAWSNYPSNRMQVFTSADLEPKFKVPYGIDSITVAVWGAGGASGYISGAGTGKGGNAGFIAGKLKVIQGETLNIIVAGAVPSYSQAYYSTIKRETEILVLGAAGGNGSIFGGIGGNAGATGQAGTLSTEPGILGQPGGGATVNIGGVGGIAVQGTGNNGTSGTYLIGGLCNTGNGGKEGSGGYGYYGGGGASTFYSSFYSLHFASGGGGGGSNYAKATGFVLTHNTHVGNITPANGLYDGGGLGGIGSGNSGAGKVVISW